MKGNSQLVCYWGSSAGLELDEVEDNPAVASRVIRMQVKISKLCCGQEHLLILGVDRRVYVMGSNAKFQLGRDGPELTYNRPTPVPKLDHHEINGIAVGWFHNLVIDQQNHVYSWGGDEQALLGYQQSRVDRSPRRVSILTDSSSEQIVKVSCGARHSILLSNQSRMYGFGSNEQHQLGLPQKKRYGLPEHIPMQEGVVEVACGTSHTLVLDGQSRIHAAGSNHFGQLGTGNNEQLTKFTLVAGGKRFQAVACGNHSAAISEDSQLYLWGTGPFGQYFSPTKVLEQKVKRIWMGTTFGVADTFANELYSWGSNVSGQLGHGNCQPQSSIERISNLPIESVEELACCSHCVIAVGYAAPEPFLHPIASSSSLSLIQQNPPHSYGKRNKGMEVLLNEQRHLESNYKLQRQHKRSLEHINEELRQRISLLTEETSTLKHTNRQLLEDCSALRLKLETAKERQRELAAHLESLQTASEVDKSNFMDSHLIQSDMSAIIKERQCEILSLQKEKIVLEERFGDMKKELQEVARANKSLTSLNQTLQASNQLTSSELAQCRNQIAILADKATENEKNIQQYILECYSLRATTSQKAQEHEELQQAFHLATDRLTRLERQNLELNKQLSTRKLLSAGTSTYLSQPPKASLEQIIRQNEIELHNYKKLLLMKDRELTEMRKRISSHQQIETSTPMGCSTGPNACRLGLRTIELLETSHNHLSVFRQLLREVHDGLELPSTTR